MPQAPGAPDGGFTAEPCKAMTLIAHSLCLPSPASTGHCDHMFPQTIFTGLRVDNIESSDNLSGILPQQAASIIVT